MSGGILAAHDMEIEPAPIAGMGEYRISCSCGFVGPWRKGKRSVYRDRDAHEDRMAAAEASRPE